MVTTPRPPDRTPSHQEGTPRLRLLPGGVLSADPKKRAKTVQPTPRDRAILQDLARFYGLTVDQIARRHFGAEWTAYHRLAALARAGLVQLHRPFYRGPGVYVATVTGARLADVGLPEAPYRPLRMAHHLAVADLAEILLRKHANVDGIGWACERRLHQAAMHAARDRRGGRLLTGVDHVPDGVLSTPSARWAVEVELTKKGDAAYSRILRWYGSQQGYRRVAWYAADESVRRRLEVLIERERLDDFMSVLPLPEGVTVRRWM